MSLLDAALVLDDLAAGRTPERSMLLAGALALDTLIRRGQATSEMKDAAAGLEAVATGGDMELDASGRKRAALLAIAIRAAVVQTQT